MKRSCLVLLFSILSLNLICQIHWNKYPDNPVMLASPAGQWDEVLISPSTVLYQDSIYKMWYWGGDHAKHLFLIGYATSPDGINWTKDELNNPVLTSSPTGSWDANTVNTPSVLFRDSIYHMWYTGYTDVPYIYRIGHATSTNGVDWIKDTVNNPVLDGGPAGSWDEFGAADATVIHDGSEFHMWYVSTSTSSAGQHLGHATSPDGAVWTRDSQNPVMIAAESWENNRIDFPKVVFDGTFFHLWYSAGTSIGWGMGYSTSTDGSSWIKDPGNPVFEGTPGTWDTKSILGYAVIDSAQVKYKMWYGGNDTFEDDSDIGYAESSPYVTMPDTAFHNALIDEGADTNGDSLISYDEAEALYSLDLHRSYAADCTGKISDLSGIEAFKNLDTLICSCNRLSSLNVSTIINLSLLNCGGNSLTSLDVSKNIALTELNINYNKITELDLFFNTDLIKLAASGNNLTSLDISKNNRIKELYIDQNDQLTEVCVWEIPFPPAGISIDTTGSPNISFKDCVAPELHVINDFYYQPDFIEATSSEDGIVYLVTGNTENDILVIREVCIDTIATIANTPVNIPLSGLTNGEYWLYARDSTGNLSEPEAFIIIGVGIKNSGADQFKVYPNPSNTLLTVETFTLEPCRIEIIGLNGQLIYSQKVEGTSHQLDLSSFQKGVYLITIRSKDFVTTRKIIKL